MNMFFGKQKHMYVFKKSNIHKVMSHHLFGDSMENSNKITLKPALSMGWEVILASFLTVSNYPNTILLNIYIYMFPQ